MKGDIALITGPDLRHRYFINRLNREFAIQSVFVETVIYPDFTSPSDEDREASEWFFRRRDEYEQDTFAESEYWPRKNEPDFFYIETGQINSPEILKIFQAQDPEIILMFGSSLIGSEMMKSFPDRILNLHLGLSGYYRGSSCNFWPIFDERLDRLGATLLKINTGIDTGEIVAQGTIEIEKGDTEQSLMGKPLILGMDLTVQAVHQCLKYKCPSLSLDRNGKLFQKKDFKPEAIGKVKAMVENGRLDDLIRTHLENRTRIT